MRKPSKHSSLVLSVRIDCRTLAALSNMYEKNGTRLRARGSILSAAAEDFLEMAVKVGIAHRIEESEEALAILDANGVSLPESSKRKLVEAMKRESHEAEARPSLMSKVLEELRLQGLED